MLKRAGVSLGVAGVLLVLSLVPFSHPLLDRGISAALSRVLNADVAAREVQLGLTHGLTSKELEIHRSGSYHAEARHFSAIPRLTLFTRRPHIRLDLASQDLVVGQDLIPELLSTERARLLHFDTSAATLQLYPGAVAFSGVQAYGSECRLEAEGDVSLADGKVNLDISVALSPEIAEDIPESLRESLLGEDAEGFRTFTLSISGRTDLASIEIMSDRFRLTTRTKNL